MILKTIIAAIINAILYRLGGIGKPFDTKYRDLGCPLVTFIWMLLYYQSAPWWVHFISFGLMFGALTTYWDRIFKEDNFYFHGFMVALAYLPYAIITGLWIGFLIRCVAVSVFMGLWCRYFSNDWIEEFGRGGITGASLPLLLIGG